MKKIFSIIISMLFIASVSGCSRSVQYPTYLKEVMPYIINEDINVEYNPIFVKRENNYTGISEAWKIGEIVLPSNEMFSLKGSSQQISADEKFRAALTNKDGSGYIIISQKVPASNSVKTVLKLYRLEDSKLNFIKTLDRARNKSGASGKTPTNGNALLSENFVVWEVSSVEFDHDFAIFGYDIKNDKIFKITSFNDYPYSYIVFPFVTYNIYANNLIIYLTLKNRQTKKVYSEIILYDLAAEKGRLLVKSENYDYVSLPYGRGAVFSGNALLATRCKLYQTDAENELHYIHTDFVNREIVKLGNGNVSVVFPKYFTICNSNNSDILLTSPDRDNTDIWIFNTDRKTLRCVLNIQVQLKNIRQLTLTNYGIIIRMNNTSYLAYYSFKYKKAFQAEGGFMDNSKNYLIVPKKGDSVFSIFRIY